MSTYIKTSISDTTADPESSIYKFYEKIIPSFNNQAVYIYSFKENKMLYAQGWLNVLGYKDSEISMVKLVNSTVARYAMFSHDLNEKALQFINQQTEKLEEYSFTLELEKIHKNGKHIPLFSRVGVYKAINGKVEEIIGISQIVKTLKLGKIMNYSTYGPNAEEFDSTLSKQLFTKLIVSSKEKEALMYAAKGFTFKEIAHELKVSKSAIEKRIIPLYKRFDVKSLTHLISFAQENNFF